MDQSQVSARQDLSRAGRLLIADVRRADAERVDADQAAGIGRGAGAPDDLLVAAALRLEGNDDEHGVRVTVGGRHRALEEDGAAEIVDLIVDVANEPLLADHPLCVLFGSCLDDDVIGAGADIGREHIGTGRADAADLELLEAL